MRNIPRLVILFALLALFAGAAAFAQPSDEDVAALKRELADLKERVRQLESNLVNEREFTADMVKHVTPEVEKEAKAELKEEAGPEIKKMARVASVDVLRDYSTQMAMSSRDILDKLPEYLPNYITKGLEFHGYFRSGYGINSKGGKMQAFQAPDSLAKYRLGNEQETYIETVFVNRNWNPDPEGITIETLIRMSYQTQQNQSWDPTNQVVLREMYGRMGHFLKGDPDAKVWAGERFYRLPELDITDFWFADMSGYGGGFEDVNLGFGKLSLAYIGYSNNDINLSTHRGRLAKNNLHLELSGVDAPFGKGIFWVNGGYLKGGIDNDNTNLKYPDMGGVDVGAIHYMPGELNNNQFSFQFGCGSNTSLSAGANLPPGGDDRKSWRFRLTDMLNRQITERLCLQAVGVYQITDYGHATKKHGDVGERGLPPHIHAHKALWH